MKKIVLLLVMLIVASNVTLAQVRKNANVVDLKSGEYATDENLEKYAGTWQWKEGKSIFKVVLKLAKKVPMGEGSKVIYYDRIEGGYLYVKDGVEIVNTLDKVTSANLPYIISIDSDGSLKMIFNDILKSKLSDAKLTLTDKDTAKWALADTRERLMFSKVKFDPTFSVPTSLQLKKIK